MDTRQTTGARIPVGHRPRGTRVFVAIHDNKPRRKCDGASIAQSVGCSKRLFPVLAFQPCPRQELSSKLQKLRNDSAQRIYIEFTYDETKAPIDKSELRGQEKVGARNRSQARFFLLAHAMSSYYDMRVIFDANQLRRSPANQFIMINAGGRMRAGRKIGKGVE